LIARRLVNGAVEDSGDLAHFVGEGDEFLRQKRLHAVGERFVRLVMNFDKKAIRADGYSSARKRQDFVAFAGTVAGINEDWKMAALFYGGENSEGEGISCRIRESSHDALAQHSAGIAPRAN